jgi:hypothetical protein
MAAPSVAQDPDDGYYWFDSDTVSMGPEDVWVIEIPAHPGDGDFEIWFSVWTRNDSRISAYLVDLEDYQTYESTWELPPEPLRSETNVAGMDFFHWYWNDGNPHYVIIVVDEGNDDDDGATFFWNCEDYSLAMDDVMMIEDEESSSGFFIWAAIIVGSVTIAIAIALVIWQERSKARSRNHGQLDQAPAGSVPIYDHLNDRN